MSPLRLIYVRREWLPRNGPGKRGTRGPGGRLGRWDGRRRAPSSAPGRRRSPSGSHWAPMALERRVVYPTSYRYTLSKARAGIAHAYVINTKIFTTVFIRVSIISNKQDKQYTTDQYILVQYAGYAVKYAINMEKQRLVLSVIFLGNS